MTAYFLSISRGVRPGQIEIDNDDLAATQLELPAVEDQRRIADFLDDRVSRIDRIIAARHQQIEAVKQGLISASYRTVSGSRVSGVRRDSGLPWLGTIPDSWPTATVAAEFAVGLGKMLDVKRQTGEHVMPYLRNSNVQWDRINTDDLKTMDISPNEIDRFTVESGDLLICEGGQPGRAAIWDGRTAPMGYQKALHRARPRGRSRPSWLLECLRVAVSLNAFSGENQQTTIGHLTSEQLRRQRLPFPEQAVQDRLLLELAERSDADRQGINLLSRSIDLLTDYKSSLITAAVSGELDVTAAGSGIPG
jgi:type I restriction enzyme S subunit